MPEYKDPTKWHKGFRVQRQDGRVELLMRLNVMGDPHEKVILNLEPQLAMELGDMLKLAGWNELAAQEKEKKA